MHAPVSIEIYLERILSIDLIEREWRHLETSVSPSFFVSWQWIGTLLAALPSENWPHLLRARIGDKTIALALLGTNTTRRRGGLVRSRGLYINETGDPRFDGLTIEHNDILTSTVHRAAVWGAVVSWFAKERNDADELYIRGLLGDLPELTLDKHGLDRAAFAVPSYSLELDRLAESNGELYPVLSANARQQLRRAFRHFERVGPLSVIEASALDQQLEFFAELKTLHCLSWDRRGKKHAFAHPFFEKFHRLLIERSATDGGIQLLRVYAGERILGYLYSFRRNGHLYAYQSGFADNDRRERPGIVAHALAIGLAFRSGDRVYDFMAGHNQLKKSVATRCVPMLEQVIQRRRFVIRVERLARFIKNRVISGSSVHEPRAD